MHNTKFNNFQIISTIILLLITVSGCNNALEGTFHDNKVCGLNYKTDTLEGITDENGRFDYMEDEQIEFAVGGIVIGKALAKEIMTPVDLVKGAKNELNLTVTNICRFLLSIDGDNSFTNGIQISSSTREDLEDETLNFSLPKETFEKRIENLKPFEKFALLEEKKAQEHLRATLISLNNSGYSPVKCSFHGLHFCPYMNNQNADTQISMIQIHDRMEVIQNHTKWILTLGCSNGMENVGRFARDKGLKIAMTARLNKNNDLNEKEVHQLINEINSGYVDMAIVGNDVLHKGVLTLDKLLAYIDEIKTKTNNVIVGYSDKAEIFMNYPELVKKIDCILLNCQPYLEGIHISSAMYYLQSNYYQLKQEYYDGKPENQKKTIIISETGWPTSAITINNAIANAANANDYLKHFIQWAETENIHYFYYEAFDEKWRNTIDSQYSGNWGIWTSNGILKEGIANVFQQTSATEKRLINSTQSNTTTVIPKLSSRVNHAKIIIPNVQQKVSNTIIPEQKILLENPKTDFSTMNRDQKHITFTDVPPFGNRIKDLSGMVFNVNVAQYNVIVYCLINNRWEIMPAHSDVHIPIQEDGRWSCDITAQRPYDWLSNKIVAFLVPLEQTNLSIDTLFANKFLYVYWERK